MREVLWLSEQDVAGLLTVADALPLVEEAFAALGKGEAQMPPKIYLDFKEYNGDLRAMPAYLPNASGRPIAAVKVVNSHPDNPAKGLPTVAAVLVLNDPATGMPLAVMGAGHLTDARTGAAGGIAAKYMARPSSKTAGLVGCGRQAVSQLEALLALFPLTEVRVAGKTLEEARAFCAKHAKPGGPDLLTCTVQDACGADIVVTTTPSRQPLVRAAWIEPGTHINAIGADAPGKQELETAVLLKARVVVDRLEQASHSGEVNVPLSSGAMGRERIVAEFGDVVAGRRPGRMSHQDITVFDSTGLAVQDAAVAAWVHQKAIERGVGRLLPL